MRVPVTGELRAESQGVDQLERLVRRCALYLVLASHRDGDYPVFAKIGVSRDPDARLKGIQTGCPLVACIGGLKWFWDAAEAREAERQAHDALHASRSNGEWFDAVDALLYWREKW